MKNHSFSLMVALLLAATICMALPATASAANTAAGTVISNTATVNYEVGGVPQTPQSSTPNTFVVDRKINLTVTTLSNPTSVASSTYQAMQFLVTNTSNTAIRFQLQAATVSGWTNTVDFTAAAKIYRDSGTTAGAWDATDTLYVNAGTFGDIASGSTLTVLIVGDVPSAAVNGEQIKYALLATAVDFGTTTVSVQTAGADTTGVDTVFADAAGTATGDGSKDGKASSSSTLTVSAAGLTISKAAVVWSDPYSGNTTTGQPKAIPGAVITYTVTVTNASGAATATNVAITDDLGTMIATNGYVAFNTQFGDATNSCAAGEGIVVNGTCKTSTNSDGDNADFTSNVLHVTGLSVAGGSSATIKYQVIIQ